MRYKTIGISKITLFIGIFIIISASFMCQVVEFAASLIGKIQTNILINLILVLVPVASFAYIIRKRGFNPARKVTVLILFIVGLALTLRIKLAVERIHILEYAFLGWFAARDLIGAKRGPLAVFLSLALCFVTGGLDELFQLVLPYRYCEWRDVLMNAAGGAAGVAVYMLITNLTSVNLKKG